MDATETDPESEVPDSSEGASPADEPAARLANQMAARFQTPDWQALRTAAERLSAEFPLPNSENLAAALANGIVMSKVERGELVQAQIDGRSKIIDPDFWAMLWDIMPTAADLSYFLEEARAGLDPDTTEALTKALTAFMLKHAPQRYVVTNEEQEGRRQPPPSPAYGFLRILAREWHEQTGKKPTAYRDKHSGQPRGTFWPFALEACAAVGFERPSIQSVENWLKPGHRRHSRTVDMTVDFT